MTVRCEACRAMLEGRAKLDMTAWKDVKTGDLVVIEQDQEVPADVVVLGSPSFAGTMAIDTANLDGETSLKLKKAVQSVNAEVTSFPNPEAEEKEYTAEAISKVDFVMEIEH